MSRSLLFPAPASLLLGSLLAFAGMQVRAQPVDILTNGGLEPPYSAVNISNANGTVTGTRPAGWQDNSTFTGTHTDTVMSEETSGTVNGSALKVVTAVQDGFASGANFQMFQSFPGVAGRSYAASVWLKGSQNGTVTFRIRQSASPFTVRASTSCAVTTSWQQFTLNLNAPANETLRLDVQLNNQPMTLWVDEVGLTVADGNREWFVSPGGLDSNDGSIGAPVQTLTRAVQSLVAGDTLWLRAGMYREALTVARSGTAANPITISAYDGESVTISGCDVASGPWTPTGNGIFTADVPDDLGDGYNQIFVDGVVQHQARHPNFGAGDLLHPATASVTVTNAAAATNPNTVSSTTFDGGRPVDFFAGARFAGVVGSGWAWQHAQITASAGLLLTVDAATKSNWWWPDYDGTSNTSDTGSGYVYGLLNLLDADGEWHLQRNASAPHTLHLRITGGADPGTHLVEVKRRAWCVDVNNFHYVTVRGLQLRAGAVRLNGTGNALEDSEARFLSHHMFYANGSSRDGGQPQGGGVVLAGTGGAVRCCTIYDTAGCGINASGSGHTITRNLIYNTDYAGSYANCINLSGTGHTVTFNTAHHSGRDIIVPGGSGHDIRYNDFSHPGQMCKDLGVLYVYAANAQGATGPPTRIAYNWVHDNLLSGASPLIYLDNWCRNFLVDHNVCWNGTGDSGIRLNGPNDGHLIYHNTLFNCDDANTHTFTLPYSHSGNPDPTFFNSSGTYSVTLANNLFLGTTPQTQLVNGAAQDFRLVSGAAAIDAATLVPGVNDGFVGAAPDHGAYEFGGPYWVPGVNGWSIEQAGVRTDATTEVGVTRAKLAGTLISAGATVTTVQVFWGTTDAGATAAGWQNQATVSTGLTGSFIAVSLIADQLTPSTTYFVRVRATNASGESWGDAQTFQTAASLVGDAGGGAATDLSLSTNWTGDTWPNLTGGLDVATFGNAGTAAVIDSDTALAGIVFNRDANFTLADGAGTLTVGAAGITVTLPTTTARTHSISESDLVLAADQTWSVTNNTGAAVLNVASNISDGANAFGFTKTGSGTVNLSGNSSYDGTTAVEAGVLAISSGTALGSTAGSTSIAATGSITTGGQLKLSGGITVAENIAISGTTEAGSFVRAIESTGGTNTLTGSVTLVGTGQMRLGPSAGTLQIDGVISRSGSDVGPLMLAPSTGASVIVAQPIDTNGSQLNISGGGTVVLNASSTDFGTTTIFFGSGSPNGPVLRLGATNALPVNRAVVIGTTSTSNGADKGTLDLAGFHQTVTALNGQQGTGATPSPATTRLVTNSAAATTSTITFANGTGTFNGTIENGAGIVAVTKSGTGTQTLSQPCTYTGPTTVAAGTLSLATASLGDTSDVNLGSGGTLNLSFTGADTVGALRIDGVTQSAGTWGGVNSSAMFKTALITGSGVLSVASGPAQMPFTSWAAGHDLDGTAGGLSGFIDDPEGDGLANGLEYVLDADPLAPSASALPLPGADATNYVFTFSRNDASEGSVTLTAQWSTDLLAWHDVAIGAASSGPDANGIVVSVIENSTAPDSVAVAIPKTLAAQGRLSVRLKATLP